MKTRTIIFAVVGLVSTATAAFLQTPGQAITRTRIQAISKGIQRYWDAYHQLPITLRPAHKSRDLIDILGGKNLWNQNTNSIAFIRDEDFDIKKGEPPLRGDSGMILDGWTNGIVIQIDYTARVVVIRSPGSNAKIDEGVGDDEIESIQFKKK